MVPGPGEEYGEEDYVLLPDVFGDMGKRQSKQPLKPSLPLHKEAGPQEREKPAKELASLKARVSGIEEGGRGLHEPRQKEKSWADQMEEDEAEAERARAEIEEEKRKWRARLHEEEVLNLDAPSGKTVMELLAEKEAQHGRAEPPKAGVSPLGEGLVKTAPPKGVSPSSTTGKEGESAPDEAMEMALKIKDPAIQARVTRVLNTTRRGSTGSKESESTTEEDEEERVSAKAERARKKEEQVKKKNKKEKGIKRGDSQVSGKEPDTKVKRSKRAEEVEEREIEEELDPEVDQEMTDAQGPFHEQSERGAEQLKERQEGGGKERTPETEPSKEETEAQRLKREQTEREGKKMVQESVETGLKRTAPEHAKSHTLNKQEGQEQEKELESLELTSTY
jgi:hypothetical protein